MNDAGNAPDPQLDTIRTNVARLAEVATADAVVGPRIEANGRTVIPLASVSAGYGFGLGYGHGLEAAQNAKGGGGGGGGGSHARPVAVVELSNEGVRVRQVVDSTRITLASLVLAAWVVFWIGRTIRPLRPFRWF